MITYSEPNEQGARVRIFTLEDRTVRIHPIDCEHCGAVRSCENIAGALTRRRYKCMVCRRENLVERERERR